MEEPAGDLVTATAKTTQLKLLGLRNKKVKQPKGCRHKSDRKPERIIAGGPRLVLPFVLLLFSHVDYLLPDISRKQRA